MKFTGERYIPCRQTDGQMIEYEHWMRYIAAARLLRPNDIVLDIACGEGYGSAYLSETAAHVFGVDISKEAVQYASEKYYSDKITFLTGSVNQIPVENGSIDLIVCFETLEHVDQSTQEQFLQEALRVLKSEGRIILSCPNRPISSDLSAELWGYHNEYHIKEHTITELQSLLGTYFLSVQLLYQRTENALMLNEPNAASMEVLWGSRKGYDNTQNIIAVCGRSASELSALNFIMPDLSLSYLETQKTLSAALKASKAQNAAFNSLQAQFSEQGNQLTMLQIRVTEKDSQIAQLKSCIKEQAEKLQRCTEELTMRMERITQLETIENSTTWRLTAPLRRMLDAIKKRR